MNRNQVLLKLSVLFVVSFLMGALGCGVQESGGGTDELSVSISAKSTVIPATGTSCVSAVEGSSGGITNPYFGLQKVQYIWSGTSNLNITTIQIKMTANGVKLNSYILPDDEMAAMICGVTEVGDCAGLNISGSLAQDDSLRTVKNACTLRVPVNMGSIKQNTTISGTIRISGVATDAEGNESNVFGEAYFSVDYEYINSETTTSKISLQ